MNTSTIRWILFAVGFILILLAFLVVNAADKKFTLDWDLYDVANSPDVKKLRVLEVNETATAIIRVWSDSINFRWTSHQFTIQDDDQLHYFVMTAVDTANNESVYSNMVILDLAKPSTVLGLRIR